MDDERRRRVKQRQVQIADTLIRAADDQGFRQELLATPQTLFGPSPANQPPPPDQVQDLRRQIVTHLDDRAASDNDFRTLLREDLFKAIRSAGLTPQMEQLRAELPVEAEVTGYGGWGWDDWRWGWGGWRSSPADR
jgi:hypothetical protein